MIDLKAHWEQIIENSPSYEHPDYLVSDWKRATLAGHTRLGYADVVVQRLYGIRCEIPKVLLQFRPKTTFGKSLQRAVVAEFCENGACIVARANGVARSKVAMPPPGQQTPQATRPRSNFSAKSGRGTVWPPHRHPRRSTLQASSPRPTRPR